MSEQKQQGLKEVDALIEKLFKGEAKLSPQLEKEFQAQREAVIPELTKIATDQALSFEDARGEGWAPIHAAELLGRLHAKEAVPALIDIVGIGSEPDILHDAALGALEQIGAPAAPPVAQTILETGNRKLKADLCTIVGKIGRDYPGTFEALTTAFRELSWKEFRVFAAWGLGDLGDARAIPILQQAQREKEVPDDLRLELREALAQLGVGTAPTPAERRAVILPTFFGTSSPAQRPGRNDPCWCGSGKKYKKCHLAEDERTRRSG